LRKRPEGGNEGGSSPTLDSYVHERVFEDYTRGIRIEPFDWHLNRQGRRARGEIGAALSAAAECEQTAASAYTLAARGIADVEDQARLYELAHAIERGVIDVLAQCGDLVEAGLLSLLRGLETGELLTRLGGERSSLPLLTERELDISRQPDAAHAPPHLLAA
jgi:hypothetical protein